MRCLIWFAGIVVLASQASADTVDFVNGDSLSGTVVSLGVEELVLRNEALGEIKVPRAKVAAVYFGERRPPAASQENAAPADSPDVRPTVEQRPDRAASGDTPDDLLKRLREGGLDGEEIDLVRKQFPLLNTPGAGTYFNKTISGLTDGSIDIQDVRKDAVRARDGLLEIKKDLGPVGGALDGYLQILDGFIEETAQPKADNQREP